jgi:hypothetical protein
LRPGIAGIRTPTQTVYVRAEIENIARRVPRTFQVAAEVLVMIFLARATP